MLSFLKIKLKKNIIIWQLSNSQIHFWPELKSHKIKFGSIAMFKIFAFHWNIFSITFYNIISFFVLKTIFIHILLKFTKLNIFHMPWMRSGNNKSNDNVYFWETISKGSGELDHSNAQCQHYWWNFVIVEGQCRFFA